MPLISAKDKKASIVQQDEVNRIRELMLKGIMEASDEDKRMQSREAALAAITIAAEAYMGQDKAAIEMELHQMVTFVMTRIEIVADTEMN